MRTKKNIAICLCVISIIVNGCSRPEQLQGQRELRIRLDWSPWAPHAAFYAAEDQGYFRDEQITVKMYVPPDPEATIKFVAAGQDDIGITYMTDTAFAVENNFNVVSIGALVPHPLNCIMTLKKSGIDKPSKLRGKIIGITGIPSDSAFLGGILLNEGLRPGSYKLVNIGFNLASALKSGNVDAIVGAYWPWEGIKLEEEGYPVYVMKLQDYGVPDYYELILVARREMAEKEPRILERFMNACIRGQQFVFNNPQKAAEVLHRASPDLSVEFIKASLAVMIPIMRTEDGIFHQDEATWGQMISFMQKNLLLKKPLAPSSLFTNEFLLAQPK